MGPGERELLLSEAISTLGRIARRGNDEAGLVVSLLLGGKIPERITDPLFDELLDRSSPACLIEFAKHAATVSELKEAGEDHLARRGEEKRGQMLSDATALESLVRLGFLPSPAQRAAMVRMLGEINASERPIDYERPHIFQGTSNARSILFGALSEMVHALDEKQCALILEACENPGEKFRLIGKWIERTPGEAAIAALFERELSLILGDIRSDPTERVRAFAIRRQIEERKTGKPHGNQRPEERTPPSSPGRKV